MQLIEFFIWRNLHHTYYNHVFSIAAILLVALQPVASLMIISNKSLRDCLLFFYLLLAIPFTMYQFSTKYIHSIISKSGHLNWIFSNSLFIWGIWFFFFMFGLFYDRQWIGIIFGAILLLISYVNYIKEHTVSSMWCWSVNSIMIYYAFYLLFYLPFLEKNMIC
jgi:hypothetical protein